jgi:hypothetical protein
MHVPESLGGTAVSAPGANIFARRHLWMQPPTRRKSGAGVGAAPVRTATQSAAVYDQIVNSTV